MTLGLKMKFFAYDDPDEIQATVDNKIKKTERFGKWSELMMDLLRRLLTVDPVKRLKANEALRHQWFE